MNSRFCLLLLGAIFYFSSCDTASTEDNANLTNAEQPPSTISFDPSDPLMKEMPHSETGVLFNNELDINTLKSPIDYINVYNGGGMGIGDINNDGLQDLYFTGNQVGNKLYLNKGNFQFEDITERAGVACEGGWSTGVTMSDVNGDGFLDMYVCLSYYEDPAKRKNQLFINNGDLTFTEKSKEYGLQKPDYSITATFFDYDNDGDQDLYLSHDSDQANILYENDGKGQFTDVSEAAGVNYKGQGMGVDAADFNNDGYLDLYITNLYENTLYLNNQDGTFSDLSAAAQVDDLGMGWGTSWMDYDNDGWVDLYVSNETYFPVNGNFYDNVMYRNRGNLTFELSSQSGPLNSPFGGYGMASFDVDRDGRLDIVIANSSITDGNQLLLNQTENEHHWITLVLEGTISNRDAVGAKALIYAGEQQWYDQVMAGTGFASQNSLQLHFGLADIEKIDSVIIQWPSGQKEVFQDVSLDSYYHILEATSITSTAEEQKLSSISTGIYPNPVGKMLTFDAYLQHNSGSSIYQIWDHLGRLQYQGRIPQGQANPKIQVTIPSTWVNGIYFLEVRQNEQFHIQRFLLNR